MAPGTPVRVTPANPNHYRLKQPARFGREGVIEAQCDLSSGTARGRDNTRWFWVRFPEGPGGMFAERELQGTRTAKEASNGTTKV